MAKKKRKKYSADNKKLRREVELLRAQLSQNKHTHHLKTESSKQIHDTGETIAVDIALVKKDFVKTTILSILAFGIIFGLRIWGPQ